MTYRMFIVLLLHVSIVKGADECTNYMELDDYRRSTGYTRDSAPICDSTITEGWYRSVSKAGSDMPTSSVPYQRCGTNHPLWINDTLPTESNATETVKICMGHFESSCYSSFTINVTNCGSYNVYLLRQTSGCAQAYCFGNEIPCPDGKSSENGFSPGCDVYPDVPLTLNVTGGLINGYWHSSTVYHKDLMFECQINFTTTNTEAYLFDVVWYFDSTQIVSFDRVSYRNLAQTILMEKHWAYLYILGFNVKCGMRVRLGSNGNPSPYQYSPFLYAGFKVDKSELILKETESALLNVVLTAPYGCAAPRSDVSGSCKLTVRVRAPRYQDQCQNGDTVDNIDFENLDTSITFPHIKWNETQTFNVTAKVDNNYSSTERVIYIRLWADPNLQHPIWSRAKIPDIKVYVADEKVIALNELCKSYNHSQITTFDGRNWDNQRTGEFVLYQHKSYPVWVQVIYTACPEPWGSATCNCGIAVRYNEDIFEANFCGNISTHYVRGQPKNQYIELNFCDDKDMKVVSYGDTYTITLPTATQVMFRHGDVHGAHGILHIQIKPSVLDIKSSSGLCGYYDGDTNPSFEYQLKNGAFTTDTSVFVNEWRIDTSKGDKSLFGRTDLAQSCVPLRQYCVSGSNINVVNCNLDTKTAACIDSKTTLTGSFFSACGIWRGQLGPQITCPTTAEATSTTYITTISEEITTATQATTTDKEKSGHSTVYKGNTLVLGLRNSYPTVLSMEFKLLDWRCMYSETLTINFIEISVL